ncbi:hypothetical protein N7492_007504 [Penicillium capsulatum]|uniref:Alpha/beta hydrolase fold-3 domain-containing protein n=1 Tax=Penicillium capsulatum TaxID=69766 RepID=A0A9W9I008_9EURO|nr:hypothetical protein N7492_007504 [Penicillium capsulatum]KAJ6117338.1 hypothetical protein N7512_007063 [Penicillium capsulatum]
MPSTESVAALLTLPFYTVAYIQPRRRQNRDWTYRQAILNTYLKVCLHTFTFLRLQPSLSLKPGVEGDRFALVEPGHPILYTGAAEDHEVKPATIGGTWYPRPFSSDPTLPAAYSVVLHLHGGSYIIGDGRTVSCHFLAKNLLAYTPSRYVFCPQYRLAGNANCRFPAQLQDAISAYSYLLHTLGIPASRIVLSGDSSGGHLALGLLRHMTQLEDAALLPKPKCIWLWSPQCDVPAATDTEAWKQNSNYPTDYIPSTFPAWGSKHFLAGLEITKAIEPYGAPIKHPFPLPSPVLIISGGQEVLFQEHREITKRFLRIPQNVPLVKLYVEETVPHDLLMIGWVFNFRKEARRCCMKAGEFLDHVHRESQRR